MKRRIMALLAATLLTLSLLTACGSSGGAPASQEESLADTMGYEEAQAPEAGGEAPAQGQKLIRTARLELETTTFPEALQGLMELTEHLGGYCESSSVGNRGEEDQWADLTIRVPVERYEEFLTQAGTICHEVWRDTSQEDVSESYYDTQGRLKTQKIKLERLQDLLTRAEAMEDIITIESAISETEQRIDELSGTLQHYDGLVAYATVHITLDGVHRLSNGQEAPASFISRLGSAFSDGYVRFLVAVQTVVMLLAYNWVWLVLLGGILFVVIRMERKRRAAFRSGGKPEDKKTPER